MSVKAGKVAAGYSAVQGCSLRKGGSDAFVRTGYFRGHEEKVTIPTALVPHAVLFSRDEFGRLLNRELIGVIGIEDKGLAEAILKETGD